MKLKNIKTWDDWCKTFQKIDTFRPLIEEIFITHNLKLGTIHNTYPGTNAVFKIDNYIIKIYVPKTIVSWDSEYHIELDRVTRLQEKHVHVPKIIAHGCIEDIHIWNYIIYERIEGVLFKDIVKELSFSQKELVVTNLKEYIDALHSLPFDDEEVDIVERVRINTRYDFITDKESLVKYVETIPLTNQVIVHGDITGDNVIYNDSGIYIIDYGDSHIAPYYYEYAPIIFDMFNGDTELINLYFVDYDKEILRDELLNSILIHDFGGNIIKWILELEERQYQFIDVKKKLIAKIAMIVK